MVTPDRTYQMRPLDMEESKYMEPKTGKATVTQEDRDFAEVECDC